MHFETRAANIFKKEAMEHNVNVPKKPNKNIFQGIRTEKEQMDDLITSDTYRFNLKNERGDEKYYSGITSRRYKRE